MAKNTRFSINCKGKLLDISTPLVMGILNSTPDSFYSSVKDVNIPLILNLAETMLLQGADILDIGGMSTRPGSTLISEQEELDRILPVVTAIHHHLPHAILSIDTFRSAVAEQAIHAGVSIVNDISGGNLDEAMYAIVAKYKVPYVCMHMQGTPQTMQQQPVYDDVVREVFSFFQHKLDLLKQYGILDVLVDPGFGFGKTLQHNYALLAHLQVFQELNCPLLIGVSRKKMIQTPLQVSAEQALNGTTALHVMALMQGASILRVHDVKEAKESITLFNLMQEASR